MKVIGIDTYNQTATGNVAKPLTSAASDADHIPCVCMETFHCTVVDEKGHTLKARDYKDPPLVLVGV